MYVEGRVARPDDDVENRRMSSRTSATPRARRTQADRSAATRDALVTAARRLFAGQGFAEVPIDAIVAAAGVTRGALYHQFADKTALFDAVMEAVEADIAVRLADEVTAAGTSDPVEALRLTVRVWLDICVEPEIHRIALIDGPSVLGWEHWREVCQRHVFGLVQGVVERGIELGRIRPQPARPLAHVLMGAGDEAALYVAEAADRTRARTEMVEVLDQFIAGVTVRRLLGFMGGCKRT
jgi:AcrR family transcriptional regulator